MSSFNFRLEQVRRYRKQLEEQAMQAFALAVQERDATLAHIKHLHTELDAQRTRLCQPETLIPAERWLIQEYEKGLREDIAHAEEKLRGQEEEVDRCRVQLIKKAQERELLDKLKEKQAARHAHEERLKEQRNYDETATLRFTPVSI